MTLARWAAVVVDYESGPLLVSCVRSLLADDSAGGPPEVVVVDNAGATGRASSSSAALAGEFPDLPVLRPGANLGYARAANLGIAATRTPIVAVLNPDTEIDVGTAAAMVARFEREPELGALGPQIRNPDGSRYPSARQAPSTTDAIGHALLGELVPENRFTRAYRELDADPGRPRDVDWVSGAALWLRRSALDAIGGWDERFFLFFEDVDLCRRLEDEGWRIAYEPGGRVMHVVGASRSGRPVRSIYEHHRAAYQYADKWWHGSRRVLLPAVAAFLALRFSVAAGIAEVRKAPRASGNRRTQGLA